MKWNEKLFFFFFFRRCFFFFFLGKSFSANLIFYEAGHVSNSGINSVRKRLLNEKLLEKKRKKFLWSRVKIARNEQNNFQLAFLLFPAHTCITLARKGKKVWRLFMFVERETLCINVWVELAEKQEEEIEGLVFCLFFKVIESWIFMIFMLWHQTNTLDGIAWRYPTWIPAQIHSNCQFLWVDNSRTKILCICLIYCSHCIRRSVRSLNSFSRWKLCMIT